MIPLESPVPEIGVPGFRRAGRGNVPTALGLWPGAKAPDVPLVPTGYALYP